MATTALQQEVLDILKVKMPESNNQKTDFEETSCDVLKRSGTPVDEYKNRPIKKLKHSDPKDLIDDEEEEIEAFSTIELVNDNIDDDASTDSDDISDDDDIEIIKEVSDVLKPISSELLHVVNSISKEVIENTASMASKSLNQSADSGFGRDDCVGEKVSKLTSDSESVEATAAASENTVNTVVDDIDCLLLSSPLKSTPDLVLNPLYHLGSSTTSEDSNSSSDTKSLSSVESLTLKVSSSDESNSSSNQITSNEDSSNSCENRSSSNEKDSDSGNNSISIIEYNKKVNVEEGKAIDINEKRSDNKLCSVETSGSSYSNGTTDSSSENSVESCDRGSPPGQIDFPSGSKAAVVEDDDEIMVVDEVKFLTRPGVKPLDKVLINDDSKAEVKDEKDVKSGINLDAKDEKDVKIGINLHDTTELHEHVNNTSSVNNGKIKSDIKTEKVKDELKKEESKSEPTKSETKGEEVKSPNSIILVELDDDDDEEDPNAKTDEKPSESEIKTLDIIKPSIDLTKIKKCYVHCEKALIPPDLPIPTSSESLLPEDADDEIELLDPYPGPESGPCSVCLQPPDRVSTFTVGNGLDEATAVRDEKISVISWEDSLQSDWPPCFKATNLSVYDSMGHLVAYDGGLIEAGHSLFFSGLLMNIVDDSETLAVDNIGPLTGWRRPEGDGKSTRLVISTCLEGTDVEYHVDTEDFSKPYKAALMKDQLYKSFSKVLSKVPSSNLNKPNNLKTDHKPSKVQIKSQSVDPDLKKVLSSLPSKTTIKITPVPAVNISSRTIRNLKRKASGSDFDPSGTSTDDDWSPDRNRPARKVTKRAASPDISDDDVGGGRNTHFKQQMKKVPTILKSLGSTPGSGKGLAKLLPGHNDSVDAVAAFLMFIYERQSIWVNKTRGIIPFTKNKVMSSKWFTNMYRELDRGTTYFRKCIIDTVLKDVDINKSVIRESLVAKVVFRSIVYRLINKVETFTDYGGLPDLEDFPNFLKFLAKKKSSGVVIFTAAHQNMGYDRLMKTFDYIKKNVKNLASQIVDAGKQETIKKCQEVLLKIPNVGAFFAWQILCDLLECRILGSCTDNQWACLGPGAKNGLRRVFPLDTTKGELKYTRLLRDLCAPSGPKSGFAALGLTFPAFLHKPLSLKNVEHALCEYDKYFRSALGVQIKEREYSEQKSRSGLDNKAKCGECGHQSSASSRVMCALCSSSFHKKCKSNWASSFHADGTWLCKECHKSEQAWGEEDFEHEELDRNDEVARAFFSGAAKKEARLKLKDKKNKKEKKVKEIECIDLSSDEEDEDDYDDDIGDDDGDEGSGDEVEYLEEIKGHFFGVDYDDTICNESDQDDSINVEQDEEDPFAGVGVWFTEEADNSNEDEVNGLEEEDILILS